MSVWGIGATVVGGVIASSGNKSAARTEAAAADRASEVVRQNFLDTKEVLEPYADYGPLSVDRQVAILGLGTPEEQIAAQQAAYSGPGFQYQRDRIIDDVNRNASASGMLKSGNRLAALTDRLQGLYAAQEDNYFNKLGAITGTGLGAASAIGGVGSNAAAGQASIYQRSGENQANLRLANAQNYGGALSGIAKTIDERNRPYG